jgi:hypothetical protein
VLLRRLESRIEQGELEIRVRSQDSDRLLKRIHLGIKSIIFACLAGFTLLSGTLLLLGHYLNWAIALFTVSGLWFLLLLKVLLDLAVQAKFDQLGQR